MATTDSTRLSDHFSLVCFHAANTAYNNACIRKHNILRPNVWFWLNSSFFSPSFFFFFGGGSEMEKTQEPWSFFDCVWSCMINQDLRKPKILRPFLVFQHLGLVFCIERSKLTIQKNTHTKNPRCFPFQNPQKEQTQILGKTNKPPLESKPKILPKVFFCFAWVFWLIHMIAICVLMFAYLMGPGKSNFDQSFSLKRLRTMWD